jgi:hypothetical protein
MLIVFASFCVLISVEYILIPASESAVQELANEWSCHYNNLNLALAISVSCPW